MARISDRGFFNLECTVFCIASIAFTKMFYDTLVDPWMRDYEWFKIVGGTFFGGFVALFFLLTFWCAYKAATFPKPEVTLLRRFINWLNSPLISAVGWILGALLYMSGVTYMGIVLLAGFDYISPSSRWLLIGLIAITTLCVFLQLRKFVQAIVDLVADRLAEQHSCTVTLEEYNIYY